MNTLDIRKIIRAIADTVASHELLTPGEYCRWLTQNEKGNRELGINEYGCADAANILYTINEFNFDAEERAAKIRALQGMQNKETGMFTEATHHTIHTTAHCAAALQLFDVTPLYPLTYLHQFMQKDALYKFLEEEVDWSNPWPQSHKGAGIYAALVCADEITEDFSRAYFDWFYENADSKTGFWKTGYAEKAPLISASSPEARGRDDMLFAYMAGGFHYMFNHEYAKMPLRYPERVIDSCIAMYKNDAIRADFGKCIGFLEIDWVYCMNRASRQTAYRRDEVVALLKEFAEAYIAYLNSLDYENDDGFNDLHMLFGTTCALAELQAALPGYIISEKPLRLVLDRRPFI